MTFIKRRATDYEYEMSRLSVLVMTFQQQDLVVFSGLIFRVESLGPRLATVDGRNPAPVDR